MLHAQDVRSQRMYRMRAQDVRSQRMYRMHAQDVRSQCMYRMHVQDVRSQRMYRMHRRTEMMRMRAAASALALKRAFFEEQINYYSQYVKTCLARQAAQRYASRT